MKNEEEFHFSIVSRENERVFELKATSSEEMRDWINILKEIIKLTKN